MVEGEPREWLLAGTNETSSPGRLLELGQGTDEVVVDIESADGLVLGGIGFQIGSKGLLPGSRQLPDEFHPAGLERGPEQRVPPEP